MRIIADILTDNHKGFLGFYIDEDNPKEEERIIEIDAAEEVGLYIYLKDKKNTLITISEDDLNLLGYEKVKDD